MFKHRLIKDKESEQETRERMNSLSEKELLVEVLVELKRLNDKCDNIARKIVIWSN